MTVRLPTLKILTVRLMTLKLMTLKLLTPKLLTELHFIFVIIILGIIVTKTVSPGLKGL